jgi:D-alanyl-D-alanine dipeptidase
MHKINAILTEVTSLSKKLCAHPIQGKLAYATCDNFLGRVVKGYDERASDLFYLSFKAATQLCKVQDTLNTLGLGLYIFDAYRPLSAVKDFKEWFECSDINERELQRKALHYPNYPKKELEKLGYVAGGVSRHCFGNTIDLSLISLDSGEILDMGSIFDYFGEDSHLSAPIDNIGKDAHKNRLLLKEVMELYGFLSCPHEYWDYEFKEREIQFPLDLPIIPIP